MKKIVVLASILLLSISLSGCVAESAPYYGGGAPYYGTAYVPGYAYGEIGVGGYYPYQRSQHIYSNYNANYWHHQRSSGVAQHSAASHGASQHGGGHGGSGGHR